MSLEIESRVDELNQKLDLYHKEVLDAIAKKKQKKKSIPLFIISYNTSVTKYKNLGLIGAFFIPYCIMLAFVGIPIFFLELSLGQFSSNGPATCWKFAKLFRGIGLGMFVVSALVAIYYNMIIGWAFYYLFASFTSELPWAECRPEWSTPMCLTNLPTYNASYCFDLGFTTELNGTCYDTNGTLRALYDEELARNNSIKKILPTQEYLDYSSLGKGFSSGIGDLGPVKWQLLLCYLLAWIFVALVLSKGVKSSGKVVYFTATFPYLVLLILLIRGVMLPGYYEGIMFYLTPKFDRLLDAQVWKDAAVQIFFSLSASWGGLIALSSYNKFHNDVFRDAIIVSFGNCLTSLFAGFVVFSYLGFLSKELNIPIDEVCRQRYRMSTLKYKCFAQFQGCPHCNIIISHVFRDAIIVSFGNCLTSLFAGFVVFSYLGFLSKELNIPIDEVVDKGPALTFVVYPFAVTKMPISPLWSILFFFMLFTLGVDSQFVLVETCVTCIIDLFPKTRNYKMMVVIGLCSIFFLLGLTLTTQGGIYMLDLMDNYAGGWNVMLIAIAECIAIVYVYGAFRFLKDIETMVGQKVCGVFPWAMWKYWWVACWGVLTPVIVTGVMVFSWVDYQRLDGYPDWADVLGWLMTFSVVLAIFIPGIVLICTSKGTMRERFREATTPTYDWGPALVKHRMLVAEYIPNYVVNPKMDQNGDAVQLESVDITLTKASGELPAGYVASPDNGHFYDEKM
ncbi:sodium- and chloride-dependent GABA transporter 2-like [Gigantopelta aegis]|uniref:sodium- and chloride-dependent GABA transporter 2-like n=1 Tax=Gigantopelta aegis TaxID=1735272 RepID=UPI001B88B772|nr:sodium- and chloride-dependent GABA transporter 2-like [Gigantopelta aegis]